MQQHLGLFIPRVTVLHPTRVLELSAKGIAHSTITLTEKFGTWFVTGATGCLTLNDFASLGGWGDTESAVHRAARRLGYSISEIKSGLVVPSSEEPKNTSTTPDQPPPTTAQGALKLSSLGNPSGTSVLEPRDVVTKSPTRQPRNPIGTAANLKSA